MGEQALVTREEQALATEQDHPQSMIAVIARAAADPRVDVQKMQALLDMQERIQTRQAEVEFNQALARLMPKLPRIEKNGVIKDSKGGMRSKWARYEDIDAVIRPLLAEEGFAISFDTDTESVPKHIKIIGTLSHRDGHSRKSSVTLPTESAVITGSQAVGATVSYGKRYVVTNMLNIITVDQDTDGHQRQTINSDQALTIRTLLQDTNSDVARFLALAKVDRVEDILEKDYSSAVRMLQEKARRMESKGR